MPKHVFLAFTNPVEGREEDFNDWQDDVHLPEGMENKGFVRVTRYRLGDAQFAPADGRAQYLNIWEIETDDIAATLAAAGERNARGTFTDAINPNTIATHIYTQCRPSLEAERARQEG